MTSIILVIHLLIAVALVIIVLLQQSEGGGLGIGGNSSSGLVSVRGTMNLLTRTTAVLAACFMLTSLTLAILASQSDEGSSVLDTHIPLNESPKNNQPSKPTVPLSQ